MSEYTKYPRGSEWRKWDLHIHTPASIHQNYGDTPEGWEKFICGLENLPEEVKVIGITDYYFIDGYEKVMSFRAKGRLQNLEKIFPILEFRIDTFGSGNENKLQKINLHILLDLDEADLKKEINKVKEEFIGQINLTPLEKHKTKKLSRENMVAEGGTLQNGFEGLVPSTKQVFETIKSETWIDKTFLFLGYKEWSNLEKNQQLKPLKEWLYTSVDAFLGNNGENHNANQNWLNQFGNKKLLHSLDIHGFDFLDTYEHDESKNVLPSQKYQCLTWIKADPTFEGLKQIKYEPEDRVKIQALKPDPKNARFVISQLQFLGNDDLFGNRQIALNENLNAIIGGKSSGKSLLMFSAAKSIDPEQVDRASKRLGIEGYKFDSDFDFKVKWKNGVEDLMSSTEPSSKLNKITYIPQLYINHLVEKNNKEELNSLIKSILLQDKSFREFHDSSYSNIQNDTSEIERLLNEYFKVRNSGLEAQNKSKDLGNSGSIKQAYEKIEQEIASGQKSSNLTPEQFQEYNRLLSEKSSLEAEARVLDQQENALNRVLYEINASKSALLGRFDAQNQIALKGQVDRILDELSEVPAEITAIIKQLNDDFSLLVKNYNTSVSKINLPEKKAVNAKKLATNKTELAPYMKKIDGQKELQKLSSQLEAEKIKYQSALSIEKQVSSLSVEYNNIRKQISALLRKRYEQYLLIEKRINETKRNIGSDILLTCTLRYKKGSFPLFEQVNKAAISTQHYFHSLFNEHDVNYIEVSSFFDSPLRLIEEKLYYSKDAFLPLKVRTTFEDILRGIVQDNFHLDYTVTYKGDNLLSMSPGKKGTVLLILFLQISSSEFPILIDQPEDNLDNRTIYDLLCKMIKEKKRDRQIIIVSHNANLVVATDTENIIVANQEGQGTPLTEGVPRFEYVNGSLEHSFSDPLRQSVLTKQGIREHVCDILEGGNEAFKQRERKYSIK